MSVLTLLDPAGWLSWLGGYRAKLSGGNYPGQDHPAALLAPAVRPENALQLDAYWACVKIIAQTIGTLPMCLYDARARHRGE